MNKGEGTGEHLVRANANQIQSETAPPTLDCYGSFIAHCCSLFPLTFPSTNLRLTLFPPLFLVHGLLLSFSSFFHFDVYVYQLRLSLGLSLTPDTPNKHLVTSWEDLTSFTP